MVNSNFKCSRASQVNASGILLGSSPLTKESITLKNVLSLTQFQSVNNLEIILLATTWEKQFGGAKKATHSQTENLGSSPSFANFLVHDEQISYIFFSVIRDNFS